MRSGYKPLLLALFLSAGSLTAAPRPSSTQQTNQPTYHIAMVPRTITAISYRNDKSTEIGFRGSPLMLAASGHAKVTAQPGRTAIDADFKDLAPAPKLGPEYATYVLWAITPEGKANNLGEVLPDKGKAKLDVTTPLETFGLIVTAEPYFAVTQPSDAVVLENVAVPHKTSGNVQQMSVSYQALGQGQYSSDVATVPADQDKDVKLNKRSKAQLELREAQNAVAIAKQDGAPQYAPNAFAKAQQSLADAQAGLKHKSNDEVIQNAQYAVQTAAQARSMALAHQAAAQAAQAQAAATAAAQQSAIQNERQQERHAEQQQAQADARQRADEARQLGQAQAQAKAAQQQADQLQQQLNQARAQAQQAQQTAQQLAEQNQQTSQQAQQTQQAQQEAQQARQKADQEAQQLATAQADAQKAQQQAQDLAQEKQQADQRAQQADQARADAQAAQQKADQEAQQLAQARQDAQQAKQRADQLAQQNQQTAAQAQQAEQARQQAQAAQQTAEQETQQLNQARQEAQQANQKADQLEQQNQKAMKQAQQAEQDRSRAEQHAQNEQQAASQAQQQQEQLRATLLQQFNRVLPTTDTPQGLKVNLSDNVLFASGKYDLQEPARESLSKLSGIVAAHPGLNLKVEGYTDNTGNGSYNEELSQKRADAVRAYLVNQGVDPGAVSATGYGESNPVASNNTPQGREENRRVEIMISGDIIGTPIGPASSAQNR